MDIVLLIDGNAIMHRAFFALPGLTNKDGIPTNAIYGFFTMLHKAISDFRPSHVVVCFDTPSRSFRKDLFKEYQSQRKKADPTFISQIPLIQELVDLSGLQRFQKEGVEADDVIGTISKKNADAGIKTFILTGDKDILQLVNEHVLVITPLKGISTIAVYDERAVFNKFGVTPSQIPDLKALMGDASDNYPGAKGIGPKTAMKLLQQFGTVEHMLEHTSDIKEDRIRGLIEAHKEDITLSKQLATILRDLDVEYDVTKCEFKGFDSKMREKLEQLELYALIGRLFGGKSLVAEKKKEESPKKVEDPQLDLFS